MSYTGYPKYLSPHFVRDEGRRLNGAFTLAGITAQLQPHELPYGVFNTGAYWVAALLSSSELFVDLDTNALESEFYAVKDTKAMLIDSMVRVATPSDT